MKRNRLLYIVVVLLLLFGGIAIAANSSIPIDQNSKGMQVFAPNEIVAISGNGSITVSSYKVIMFNADVTIQINGSGSTYDWPADTPLGIGSGVTTLTLSGLGAATTALVM